jgi:hypothetical protein
MRVSAVVSSHMMRKEVLADCVVSGSGSRRRGEPREAVLASRSWDGVGSLGPEGLVRS